ncbi:hypothetical protein ACHAXT_011985 [Thalassiosira profunda]
MSSPSEAVVSAHDWVRGIALSVLASMIGGAAKLSIRKSWLIDAKQRGQIDDDAQPTHHMRDAYEEVFSPRNDHDHEEPASSLHRAFGSEASLVVPLEVGSPPRMPSDGRNPEESFSFDDERAVAAAEADEGGGCFFNADPLLASRHNLAIANSSEPRLSQKQLSWLLYLAGFVGMSFLNPLCCVLAMKYANPSILAPFSGLTLVWVVLFAGAVVDEHPGRMQVLACALIVMGEVLVATFGDHTNGEGRGSDDVLASYREPGFRTFALFMVLFLVQLVIFIRVCPKHALLRKVAWGSIGGSITGFQNFLKDALTIFDATMSQSQGVSASDGLPAAFFLFVVLSMLTAFAGLLCLASCMKRYDATYSAAMFVCSFVVSTSLMSCVHYSTFRNLDGWASFVMYPLGLLTLFMGAFVLVKPGTARAFCRHQARDTASAGMHLDASMDSISAQRERLLNGS